MNVLLALELGKEGKMQAHLGANLKIDTRQLNLLSGQ